MENSDGSRQDYLCSQLRVARFTQVQCNAFAHPPAFFFGNSYTETLVEEEVAKASIPTDLRRVLEPVFRDLHTLVRIAPDIGSRITACNSRYMAFTRMRHSLDHRAFDLPMALEHQAKHYSSTLIACCAATIAFTHMTIRDYKPTCKNPWTLLLVPHESMLRQTKLC